MRFKTILSIATRQQKEQKWEIIRADRTKYFESLYKKTNSGVFVKLSTLEFDGGNCFNCNKPWVKIEFDNPFLKGLYYEPDCDCFVQCPECETWLYDKQFEFKGHLMFCDNCFFRLIEKETDKKRYGLEYKEFYQKLSRKRQLEILNDR